MLLKHPEPSFSEPVGQAIFIDLLSMPMPVILVQGKARLPDDVAEFKNWVFHGFGMKWPQKGAEGAKIGDYEWTKNPNLNLIFLRIFATFCGYQNLEEE